MGVVRELHKARIAVQLEHQQRETSREDHGFVHLKTVEGVVLAESADFQHNRNDQTPKDISALVCNVLAYFESKSKSVTEPSEQLSAGTVVTAGTTTTGSETAQLPVGSTAVTAAGSESQLSTTGSAQATD